MTELSDQQLLRYSRQIFLPNIDVAGQQKLSDQCIIIMGAGGLGSLSSAYLAGAGVGKLVLVDDDVIDVTNLHRQLLYTENDIGLKKVDIAAKRLASMNADCEIEVIDSRLDVDQLQQLCVSADLLLDGTDNFSTRLLVNQACYVSKTPLITAAVTQFSGQLSTFDFAEGSPCYQCLYPDVDDVENNCTENGVLGPNVGLMASLQALHAIKFILGLPVESLHRLMVVDMLNGKQRNIALKSDVACLICGKKNRNNEKNRVFYGW